MQGHLQQAPGPMDLPGGTETILVVEDDAETRAMAVHVLEGLGYSVLEAVDGDEAWRVIIAHAGRPIHLLFTNLAMPHMGGRELAQWLQDVYPETKLLFSHSTTDGDDVRDGLLDSEARLLGKPYTPDTLARAVRSVLDM
jgi:CheY-like chemotaxis protein